MSWSLITSTALGASGGGDITTSAINTSGADLIVIGVSVATAGGPASATVSDSYGNTWSVAKSAPHFNDPTTFTSKLYYCQSPGVGSGHTFSSVGAGFGSICVVAWSGSATSPLDVTSQNAASWGPDFDIDDVTPTVDNTLCLTHVFDNRLAPPTITESYVVDVYTLTSAGNNNGGAIARKIQTTATTTGPVWTPDGVSTCSFAAFKMGAGGGGGAALRPKAYKLNYTVKRASHW